MEENNTNNNNNQEITQRLRRPGLTSNHRNNVESGGSADQFQDHPEAQPSSRLREFALWFHLPTYSTFRYGMITVYVGTLLMVIGYHNPWIAFTRILGFTMVMVGSFLVFIAFLKSFKDLANNENSLATDFRTLETVSGQVEHDNKQGLPTYEMAVATELPTYEEAQALSLNPSSFKFKTAIPKSPPPAWSPVNNSNNNTQQSESPVTIHQHCDNPTTTSDPASEIQQPQQPPIYQLFARASPNQIQPFDSSAASVSPNINNQNSVETTPRLLPNNHQNSIGISTPRLFIINETQPNHTNSLENGNNISGDIISNDFRGRARSRSAVTFEENESHLTNNNNSTISERQFQSAVDRRRSFINERPKTAISGIVRSYSSSSFESPDENSDSDSSWDEEVTSTANHDNSNSSLRTNSTQVTTLSRATQEEENENDIL